MSVQYQPDTGNAVCLAHLEVVSGIHSGVSIPVDTPICRIGSDADSDIVLSDADVSVGHAVIRIHGRRLAIEAAGGDLTVGEQFLAQGTGCHTQFPVTLSIGDARVRLNRPGAHLPLTLSVDTSSRLSRFGMMTALTLTLLGTIYYQVFDVKAGADIFQQAAVVSRDDNASSNDLSSSPSSDDIVDALNQRMSLAGLNSLTATRRDQRIMVSGRLAFADTAAWTDVQQWFDRHYGTDQVLTTTIDTVGPARPDIEFQAVWLGDHPYVIDGAGKRRYAGSAVADGWVLDDISRERITLSRGEDQFALTL